jgi:predicted Zn-dependent peptidase
MLFTGTERWNEKETKEVITRRGGKWNGWTGQERTGYFAQVSVQDIEIALDWLAQLGFHATLPADKVDKEREVIFQEKSGRYGWLINTLDELGFGYELSRDIRRALFPNSTLGLRVGGEDASLEGLDRAALWDYYQNHYTPGNAVLIVVGNVTPERIFELAEMYFGDLSSKEKPIAPESPPPPVGGPHNVVVRGPLLTDQARLMVGARTVGRTHPDRWPLELLAEILSRDLMEDIRYQRGLVYSLSVYNTFYDDTGYFAISTNSQQEKKREILETIEIQLERVRQGEVDAEQVAQAQAALKGRWALSMEDNMQRAVWLAEWSSVLAADEPLPDYQVAIDAVTPADLTRVVEDYFTPQRRYQGIHQPIITVISSAQIAAAILGLGASVWLGRKLWRRSKSRNSLP